jgi:hypothetical protein
MTLINPNMTLINPNKNVRKQRCPDGRGSEALVAVAPRQLSS